jgi:hypothetical protein
VTATVGCGACGGQTLAGKKFCIHCGAAVGRLRAEAAAVFEQVEAKPWLERAQALGSAVAA